MTQKKTAKKKAKKKASKPAAKKPVDIAVSIAELIRKAQRDDPELEELFKSNEAKLYLTGIKRASTKLQNMIARERALRHHPGHPDHAKT